MAFYYLLLGHLIGDFVLQTDKMAGYKSTHWKWNLLHTSVVTLSTFVFSYAFGTLLVVLVLLNGVTHFILDYYKNEICRHLHFSGLSGFIFDQSAHILLLYLISLTAVYSGDPFIDFATVKFLIGLVMITSFSAVFTQFILAALFPRSDSSFFEDGEKYMGIFTRMYVWAVLYVSLIQSPYVLFLLLIIAGAFFSKFKRGWYKWMSPSQLVVKMLLDAAISAVCIFPILF